MLFLLFVYVIDLCVYVVMSNYVYVVLRVDEKLVNLFLVWEVLIWWYKFYKGILFIKFYLVGEVFFEVELLSVKCIVVVYWKWLFSISWFMWDFNEYIVCVVNVEDECKGCFWEGCFKF